MVWHYVPELGLIPGSWSKPKPQLRWNGLPSSKKGIIVCLRIKQAHLQDLYHPTDIFIKKKDTTIAHLEAVPLEILPSWWAFAKHVCNCGMQNLQEVMKLPYPKSDHWSTKVSTAYPHRQKLPGGSQSPLELSGTDGWILYTHNSCSSTMLWFHPLMQVCLYAYTVHYRQDASAPHCLNLIRERESKLEDWQPLCVSTHNTEHAKWPCRKLSIGPPFQYCSAWHWLSGRDLSHHLLSVPFF